MPVGTWLSGPSVGEPTRTIELIEDDSGVDRLLEVTSGVELLPLDTEFHREKTYFPKLALIQIAVGSITFLVDPLAVDVRRLATLFGSDRRIVMHACRQDLEVLEHACGAAPVSVVDTQLVAGFLGYSTPSLASLMERELGISVPKADRLTDWLRRPLTDRQITYAASDVDNLAELHERLDTRLVESGRSEWCDAATAELLAESRGPRDPDQAWRRIKEVRHLRGQDLATAQRLAAWRERRAASLDVTPRFVVADLGLVGLAVARPDSVSGLSSIRGVDAGSLKSVATAIFEVIEASLGETPERNKGSRRDDLPTSLKPAVPLATAWLSQQAKDLSIDPALLATRADIEAFLRNEEECRLLHGWRHAAVGAPLRDLIDGKVAMAFDSRRGLVLEPRDNGSE